MRCGARAIWLKLNCLYPNLQKVELGTRRKDTWNRRHILCRHALEAGTTSAKWSDAQRGHSRR
jgi:hypothetical protein